MSTPLVSDECINGYDSSSGKTLWTGKRLTAADVRRIYEAELQSLRERISRIDEAATNVLNRWDSPNWEWDKHGHTAGLMADLRNALDRLQAQQSNEVPLGAIMEAVAEGMNKADDAGEDPMSWIQSCVSRIRGVSDITDAERLPVVKLKPQQPNAEPVAWCVKSKDWGLVTSPVKWSNDCKPLYDHPPSTTEPRLTVEQAMEVVKEWCFDWCERVAPDQNDWANLNKCLTKAAKP